MATASVASARTRAISASAVSCEVAPAASPAMRRSNSAASVGMRAAVGLEARAATRPRLRSAALGARPSAARTSSGISNGAARPADRRARRRDLVGAQRLAVRLGGAGARSGEPLADRGAAARSASAGRHWPSPAAIAASTRRGVVAVDRRRSRSSRRPRSAAAVSSRNQPCDRRRRSRCRCRRRARSACPAASVPASEQASWLMPSIRQPSPRKT